ncbi:MAG: HNH endonuclease [Sedimentisphaerales bacterium]|nr:HNH endonuclease [Sedimentisphaerales bacterium]
MKHHFTINIPNWLDHILVAPLLLYRRLRFGFLFRRIPLTQEKFALVDPDDYPALIKHKWSASKWGHTFYAVRSQGKIQIKMHRQITAAPPYLIVDHADHNGLNNTKQNLRLCTQSENAANQRPRRDGSSKYKGVCWNKRDKVWDVRIRYNRRNLYIGSFKSELDAAKAYDSAAKFYKGTFACTNFDT